MAQHSIHSDVMQQALDHALDTYFKEIVMPIFPTFRPFLIGFDLAKGPDRTGFAAGGKVTLNTHQPNTSEFFLPVRYWDRLTYHKSRVARPDMAQMLDDVRRAEEDYAKSTMIRLVDRSFTITERSVV